MKKICILGLGYIGLPTAAMFSTHGHRVVGVDINNDVIGALNNGKTIITEPNLDQLVQEAVKSGNLVGKNKPEEADVFIIAVPTPINEDKKADMEYVISAIQSILPYVRKGSVIVLESTSPIGTIRDIIIPILEKNKINVYQDVFLAYCPERVTPGKTLIEMIDNNRIIGGINKKSAEIVRELYKSFVKGEILITDSTTAEMCKLMENTFRDVNIALANELAMICENIGVNASEVIKLCNKHPRVNIHEPGPGVGGHCIAVDPWFIVEQVPSIAKIIRLARETNSYMPEYVMFKIEKLLGNIVGRKNITIMGMSYKADIDDMRESPIIRLVELLDQENRYNIKIYDPYIESFNYKSSNVYEACCNSDLIVIGTFHKEFENLDYKRISKLMRNATILDTRNSLCKEHMESIGFEFYQLGNGNLESVKFLKSVI